MDSGRALGAQKTQPLMEWPHSSKKTQTFPHTIVFDLEALQDHTKGQKPCNDVILESTHVSVSLLDMLNRAPDHTS